MLKTLSQQTCSDNGELSTQTGAVGIWSKAPALESVSDSPAVTSHDKNTSVWTRRKSFERRFKMTKDSLKGCELEINFRRDVGKHLKASLTEEQQRQTNSVMDSSSCAFKSPQICFCLLFCSIKRWMGRENKRTHVCVRRSMMRLGACILGTMEGGRGVEMIFSSDRGLEVWMFSMAWFQLRVMS